MNLSRADGSVLIAYANSRADTNDIIEELLEAYIKHQLNTNPVITEAHLAAFLTEVDKHLPGKSILPKNKKPGEYSRSDLVEAFSRLALASYIYQEAHLPLSPGGHQLLQNIGKILDTATTESDRLTKREAAARAREHHRAIVRSAAKGRVYQTLSSMLEVTADALDSYLKHQLLQKLDRLTATVKIKRSPSKRLQGKMTAPAYRELERAINHMALSPCAHETGMAQLNSTSMPS